MQRYYIQSLKEANLEKPNVLIITSKFAEVSRTPLEMLVGAGMQVHEHSDDTAGSITEDRFCELIRGMDVLPPGVGLPLKAVLLQPQ